MSSAHRACIAIGIAAAAVCDRCLHAPIPVLDYTLGVEVENDSNVNLSRTDPVSSRRTS